ncbi:Alpha/Beta hydrolase protein, partial [Thamnocephalis sphaerospora]
QVAACVGGSMGGMQTLEWAALFGSQYVRNIVPIATCGRHSAWGISWGEAQRRSIASDPKYRDGRYSHDQAPKEGLAAARMSAMLTYRSRDSFESRFGRRKMAQRAYDAAGSKRSDAADGADKAASASQASREIFSAQSYLRYQGAKFCDRFDANCYVAITRKMDTHDLARDRSTNYEEVLSSITQPALVIGVESDGLFTINEQYELADLLPGSEMAVVQSPDGHDGFLLEFDQLNRHILRFLRRVLPTLAPPANATDGTADDVDQATGGLKATKTSMFGEAEADVTCW